MTNRLDDVILTLSLHSDPESRDAVEFLRHYKCLITRKDNLAPQNCRYLIVDAEPRYLEDGQVDGKQDNEANPQMPFIVWDKGAYFWRVTIDLLGGRILNWPHGITAAIHYKVCDQGEYWLSVDGETKNFKYASSYVPSTFLCHGTSGHGDYIVMSVDHNGRIMYFN